MLCLPALLIIHTKTWVWEQSTVQFHSDLRLLGKHITCSPCSCCPLPWSLMRKQIHTRTTKSRTKWIVENLKPWYGFDCGLQEHQDSHHTLWWSRALRLGCGIFWCIILPIVGCQPWVKEEVYGSLPPRALSGRFFSNHTWRTSSGPKEQPPRRESWTGRSQLQAPPTAVLHSADAHLYCSSLLQQWEQNPQWDSSSHTPFFARVGRAFLTARDALRQNFSKSLSSAFDIYIANHHANGAIPARRRKWSNFSFFLISFREQLRQEKPAWSLRHVGLPWMIMCVCVTEKMLWAAHTAFLDAALTCPLSIMRLVLGVWRLFHGSLLVGRMDGRWWRSSSSSSKDYQRRLIIRSLSLHTKILPANPIGPPEPRLRFSASRGGAKGNHRTRATAARAGAHSHCPWYSKSLCIPAFLCQS